LSTGARPEKTAVVGGNIFFEHNIRDGFTQMGTICPNDYKCEIMLFEGAPRVRI